jgi:HEAT repeat protein
MGDLHSYAAYHIERLKSEPDNASCSLIHANPAIVPILIQAFRAEEDAYTRAMLIEIICRHQPPHTVEFLAEALNKPEPQVWKAALDWLVWTGGDRALTILESAKHEAQDAAQPERLEWIDEAIRQVQRGIWTRD